MSNVWMKNVILGGIVGSTAYGMATPSSDEDRLGVRLATSAEMFGLFPPILRHNGSWTSHDPDVAVHEALKFCHLALGANPTVIELLWLPDELYEIKYPAGWQLIQLRDAFLCRRTVRRSYLGYATQQFERLKSRGDGSFSADTRKRTAKHARHLRRLLSQGCELLTTGRLRVRLTPDEVETLREFGESVAAGDLDAATRALRLAEDVMDAGETVSPLPERPDERRVERWLYTARCNVRRPPLEAD